MTTTSSLPWSPRRLLATSAGRTATLLRWLGPWADVERAPRVQAAPRDTPIRHVRVRADDGDAPRPTVLLLPGLHFLGADDARFRRFAAVLAATGADVIAPHLTDLLALHLTPNLLREAEAALDFACEVARGPVGVMSISFGSIAALHLAANRPDAVKRVVLFGGYRRPAVAFRFALGGEIEGFPAETRDPLNGPAVLGNLAEELLPDDASRAAFRQAALAFARATWSRSARPENKRDGRHLRVGRELLATLDGEAAALWRVACRLDGDDDVVERAQAAIARAEARIAFLDATPLLPRIAAPVTCVHGRDDDVIPYTESIAIARDVPRGRALVTGIYGHTGRAGGGGGGASAAAMARELATMGQVLGALAALTG